MAKSSIFGLSTSLVSENGRVRSGFASDGGPTFLSSSPHLVFPCPFSPHFLKICSVDAFAALRSPLICPVLKAVIHLLPFLTFSKFFP
ncbi:hypothetical protein V6N13_044661 [Hibiscus sabdariffa]